MKKLEKNLFVILFLEGPWYSRLAWFLVIVAAVLLISKILLSVM